MGVALEDLKNLTPEKEVTQTMSYAGNALQRTAVRCERTVTRCQFHVESQEPEVS